VGGYGTDQAVAKFKNELRDKPGIRTAVLMVMHENTRRVVNSQRFAYHPSGSNAYRLKPYVRGTATFDLDYPKDFQRFMDESRRRLRQDYWAKPKATFPYALSFARSLLTPTFASAMVTKITGSPYAFDYEYSREMPDSLETVLLDFVRTADGAGIRPFIVFIPSRLADYRVSEKFVARVNVRFGRRLAYEFVDDAMDWSRYLPAAGKDCHPSPYGYERIADFVAGLIRNGAH
jgi:hypothetical protein